MKNPILDQRHIREYLLFGSIAAICYMIPVFNFLYHNKYENLYYLYIGCALFMPAIFYYTYKLLNRRYEGKRTISMLLAGQLATLAGIAIAIVLVAVTMLFFFPHLFSHLPADRLVKGAPVQTQPENPGELLLMILSTTIIGNFAVGSFISVLVAYAGEKDQTGDKPTNLETHLSSPENR